MVEDHGAEALGPVHDPGAGAGGVGVAIQHPDRNPGEQSQGGGIGHLLELLGRAVDAESAYEMLQKRVAGTAASADEADDAAGGGGILGQLGAIVGTVFGTNVKRGSRLSTGQVIARDVTRSVTNKVIGGVVADLGKSVGGSLGGSVGRALVRGALGGLLRR